MNLNYSIHEIDRAIIEKLKQCRNEDVLDTLKKLLDFYMTLLKEHTLTTGDGTEIPIYSVFGEKVKKNCSDVFAVFSKYNNGNLIECNAIISRLFKRTANKLTSEFHFPKSTIHKDSIWYRMRNNGNCEEWDCNELFHVPFEKR